MTEIHKPETVEALLRRRAQKAINRARRVTQKVQKRARRKHLGRH